MGFLLFSQIVFFSNFSTIYSYLLVSKSLRNAILAADRLQLNDEKVEQR